LASTCWVCRAPTESFARPNALRLFAAAVPMLVYASYFGVLLAAPRAAVAEAGASRAA
jgi:hypothetical protein